MIKEGFSEAEGGVAAGEELKGDVGTLEDSARQRKKKTVWGATGQQELGAKEGKRVRGRKEVGVRYFGTQQPSVSSPLSRGLPKYVGVSSLLTGIRFFQRPGCMLAFYSFV